jgi:predicted TIM-barrel fold metal-dependent hydrolase
MIVDCHVHLGKTEKSNRWFSFETFNSLMDRFRIDRAVVMPNMSSMVSVFDGNRFFMDGFYKAKKGIFYPFLVIDPFDGQVFGQIRFLSDIIFGLKLHPSISRIKADDRLLCDYYEFASKQKLPILVHCGRDSISNISFVISAAAAFPDLVFIAANLGGNASDIIEEALIKLQNHPLENIYLDTSSGKSPWLVEEAVKVVGPDRVLFGSDEPYADIRICRACVELADLSDEVKENILSKNILRLLRV